ncbi:cadherin-like domain-containing protein [Granulosicoccus antarcticus]|uniref:Cadherin domain-containing protein n=1 Tax=Granulosicoccus antarcticus IMCC3135 TaxID=1192854 RepID=A0A2Z2NMZ7_9GAMM|nr:cadherin-like domain-containing protein [Granulosicoccus antarcticus]ASJ72603.1 hypothetical protein IMCC3135_12575 [Granulosicoccus antarcticus IMCC3135]
MVLALERILQSRFCAILKCRMQVIFKSRKSRHDKMMVHRALIDPLEPRLLYSADHPLGLAVAFDDSSALQDELQSDHASAIDLAAGMEVAESEELRSVAFVDRLVVDFDGLSSRLESQGIVVHAIDSSSNGVEQVTSYLSAYSELDAVMIYSHGADSGFTLGSSVVNSETLSLYESEMQAWGDSLSANADLLLFGCDVADDLAGQTFLSELAELTQADVAASDDITGHADRGGNWELEWRSGVINTALLDSVVLDDWQGTLESIIVTTTVDLVDAGDLSSYAALQSDKGADNKISLREAVLVANNDASVSLISLSGGTPYSLVNGHLEMSGNYVIAGMGADNTIIDQLDTERVITVQHDSNTALPDADITLTDLTITGGDTNDDGGGIFIDSESTVRLDSVIIRDNVTANRGGGIANEGTLIAENVRLSSNVSQSHGGGIYTNSSMSLTRVSIDNNTANLDGGGIYQKGDSSSSTLDYVTISKNEANKGGAIDAKGDITIQSSTIVDNTANNDGGGIREHGFGTISLYNTVLADNIQTNGTADKEDVFGDVESLGFNFIENEGGINLKPSDLQGASPMLAELTLDSGGIMKTLQPLSDSPLINRGGLVSSQLDATGREIDAIPDIGAHEFQGVRGVLYWSDDAGIIYRSNADGTHAQTVFTADDSILDLEVDAENGRLYWLDSDHYVWSAALDGSDATSHFQAGSFARGIALDIAEGDIIVSESFIARIKRFQLSDGSSETLIEAALPSDVEFDVASNTAHWLERNWSGGLFGFGSSKQSINSLNLTTDATSDVDISAITEISTVSSLVLNGSAERLYWVNTDEDSDKGYVGVQELSGGGVSAVESIATVTGTAYDTLNDRLIVTTGSDGKIISYGDVLADGYDELHDSGIHAGSIAYLAITSAAPELVVNDGAQVDEGLEVTINESVLLYEGSGTDPEDLQYSITSEPTEGEVQKSGVKVSTFTQADLNANIITYKNNGEHVGYETEWTDTFTFELSDGVSEFSNQIFSITVNDVDDATEVGPIQPISVDENMSVAITNDQLQIFDRDTPDAQITITASNLQSGVLELNGVETSVFTLADLKTGGLLFKQDGSEQSEPVGFNMMVTSEGVTTSTIPVTIDFGQSSDDVPVPITNIGLALQEGQLKPLTFTELKYQDDDTVAASIVYTFAELTGDNTFVVAGTEQNFFTQEDLDNNRVYYRDDGTHVGVESTWIENLRFSVSDGNSTIDDQLFELRFTNFPDAPVEGNNIGLDLTEGELTQLTTSQLEYRDDDTATADISYSIFGLTGDNTFVVSGTDQDFFSQEDIDEGRVFYRDEGDHVGLESNWTEDVRFTVGDGTTIINDLTFELRFTAVSDAPVLSTNIGLDLLENEHKLLTKTELEFRDNDTATADILYSAFDLTDNSTFVVGGVEQNSFSQEDLDNGQVYYRDAGNHVGVESSWSEIFHFSVSDGNTTINNQTFELRFTDVPDAPVELFNNGLALLEGENKLLTALDLQYTDDDTAPADILYTASGLPGTGTLIVAGIEQNIFSQDDLDNDRVYYRDEGTHEGVESSWTESFTFSVEDGDNTISGQSFELRFTDVPDAPVKLNNNGVALLEGENKLLTRNELEYTDVDTAAADILYTASGLPSTGELIVDGSVQSFFSQDDLDKELVYYRDDGTQTGPESSWTESFTFSITDGDNTISDQSFELRLTNVPDAPVKLNNNGLALLEGANKLLTRNELEYTDDDTTPANILYTASGLPSTGSLIVDGSVQSFFSQEDLDKELVYYRDDGTHAGVESSWAESFTFSVSDGDNTITDQSFELRFTDVPDAPVKLNNNGIALLEGENKLLTRNELEYTDVDTAPADILYIASGLPSTGTLIVDDIEQSFFSQEDLNNELVYYRDDGTHTGVESSWTESFTFLVDDGDSTISDQSFELRFTNVADEPVELNNNGLALLEGENKLLSSNELHYTDDDTASVNISYIASGLPTSGSLWVNGSEQDFFSQDDLDNDLVYYRDDGTHVGEESSWIESFTFSVSDGDSTISDQSFELRFTDVPDAPVELNNNGLALLEGENKLLSSNELHYTDDDTASVNISYIASGLPTSGSLWVNGSEQDFFSQDDLDNDLVYYRDDGTHVGEESSWIESFTFSVSDGDSTISDQSFELRFTNVADEPVELNNNGLALLEGENKLLTRNELEYTDVDTASADILYTASGLPGTGRLIVAGIEQSFFSQEDLDNELVYYRDDGTHAGEESSWTESFTFSLSDGDNTISDQSFELRFTDVPDAPVELNNNGLALLEGEDKLLTRNELEYTDVDTAVTDVGYVVTGLPPGGSLWVDGSQQNTFSQDELDNNLVYYRDDGSHIGEESAWTESFTFSLSDGDNTISDQSFELRFTNVPDEPVELNNNGLALLEGENKLLTALDLLYTDDDTAAASISYVVTGLPTSGSLWVNGSEQTFFSQDDLDNDLVYYRDDGMHIGEESAWTQSFTFSVSDGDSTISDQSFELRFTNVPDELVKINNNGATLLEGENKLLTSNELKYTDVDTAPADILYTASGLPSTGMLIVGGNDQSFFSQDDLDNDRVYYRDAGTHEGVESNWIESFRFSVSDGSTTIDNQTFELTFTDVPDAPILTLAENVSLEEGSQITLSTDHILVKDVDTSNSDIRFTIAAVNSGQLLVDEVIAETFFYDELVAGRVSFKHDGSEPSMEASVGFSVSDATSQLPTETLVFSISPVHDQAPVATDHMLSGNRGALMSQLETGSVTLLQDASDGDEPVGTLATRLETTASHGTVSIDTNGTFNYQHDGSETFRDSFTYSIIDEGGNASAPAVVSIFISGNTTPVTNGSIDSQVTTELQAFTLSLDSDLFSDTPDDSLIWQTSMVDGSPIPQWLSFDSTDRTFSGTPGDADTGEVELRVQAIDTHGAVSAPIDFVLTVNDINQPSTVSVGKVATVVENQKGAFLTTINANDPDSADIVTVSLNDPRFQIADSKLSLKPDISLDYESEPEFVLTITASDGSGDLITSELPVQVEDDNDSPVLDTEIRDLTLEGESLNLIPADWFSDQDGDVLQYTWKLASGEDLPDWIVFNEQGSTLSLGEIPENVSTQAVVLTATDGRGGVAQLFLDLHLPLPVVAPANPTVEPTPEEPERSLVSAPLDLDELASNVSVESSKSIRSTDSPARDDASNLIAAVGVSATRLIPLIVDVDPVSVEGLSDRIQSIRDTRVISEQIGDAFTSKRVDLAKPSISNVFNGAINLNDLFSFAERQDVQTLAELAKEFEKQREQMESRENFNTAVVGSSITLSSGLSVGYLIYLIRGGAIVSSMLSSLPAWRFVDPLPILNSMGSGSDSDGETLASIVSQDAGK